MGALPFAGGAAFRVWAPHAGTVTVAGDFNDWSTTSHLPAHEGSGYWSGEVAGARPVHLLGSPRQAGRPGPVLESGAA